MKMRAAAFLLAGLATADALAAPGDVQLHGYVDLRLRADDDPSQGWRAGGLEKFAGQGSTVAGALAAHWQISPAWQASAELQADTGATPNVGLLEAWVRYRPVSLTPWRWSVRAGSFFPPVSLENDGIGWTSRWTLSPSAINSWVGEELRSTGLEVRVERRLADGTLAAGLATFGGNDPAGELLASRGWALGDATTALGAWVRQPDAYAANARTTPPVRFRPFVETDHRLGWHADLGWTGSGDRRWSLLHYDNRADPQTFDVQEGRRVFSWRTRFSSAGLSWPVGRATVIAQAMHGSTAFEPRPGRYLDTRIDSAFLLAGWDLGADWRPALRWDAFRLRQRGVSPGGTPLDEHGHALTAALAWRPTPGLRLSAEWLLVSHERRQRIQEGLSPESTARQWQVSVRLIF